MNKKSSSIMRQQGVGVLLLSCILSLCFIQPAHGRQSNTNKPLEIGDKVPAITLRNVINHTDSIIYPEEWKGKLVILSFWATWCSVCIEQMPKMAALQEEFGDRLLIIHVTQDDSVRVNRLLKALPLLQGINLPYATSTVLDHYFPHRTVPHEVWISPEGQVFAITGHNQVNKENIQKFLDSSQETLTRKKDITDYDIRKPLMAGGLGSYQIPAENIKYSRMITTYIPGLVNFRSNVNKYGDRVTIKCTNTIVQDLYVHAIATNPYNIWPQNKDFYLRYVGRILWEARDSTLYSSLETRSRPDRTADSLRVFNYEIILPRRDSARINDMMLQDLNDYFGTHYNLIGAKEKRKVKCWELVKVDSTRLISAGGQKQILVDAARKKIKVVNATVDEFMFRWQSSTIPMYFYPVPIINETGISSPIDIELNVDPSDFEAVKKAISAYGLEFRLVHRVLDMIVISNKL